MVISQPTMDMAECPFPFNSRDGPLTNSLHEQLLKAGLVDEKKLQKAKKAKQRKEKEQRHSKQKTQDESARLAKQARAREAERNRELNRLRQEEAQHKAVQAQVRQLIEQNRIDLQDCEIPYNFNDGGKIRRLYVTEKLQGQLSQGRMGIVKLAGRYEVLPREVMEKIAQRDASCVVLLNDKPQAEDPNDPYAAFKVPDDLMW
jgi:uncharacterized protein YaiL (DUF2058 family)